MFTKTQGRWETLTAPIWLSSGGCSKTFIVPLCTPYLTCTLSVLENSDSSYCLSILSKPDSCSPCLLRFFRVVSTRQSDSLPPVPITSRNKSIYHCAKISSTSPGVKKERECRIRESPSWRAFFLNVPFKTEPCLLWPWQPERDWGLRSYFSYQGRSSIFYRECHLMTNHSHKDDFLTLTVGKCFLLWTEIFQRVKNKNKGKELLNLGGEYRWIFSVLFYYFYVFLNSKKWTNYSWPSLSMGSKFSHSSNHWSKRSFLLIVLVFTLLHCNP